MWINPGAKPPDYSYVHATHLNERIIYCPGAPLRKTIKKKKKKPRITIGFFIFFITTISIISMYVIHRKNRIGFLIDGVAGRGVNGSGEFFV